VWWDSTLSLAGLGNRPARLCVYIRLNYGLWQEVRTFRRAPQSEENAFAECPMPLQVSRQICSSGQDLTVPYSLTVAASSMLLRNQAKPAPIAGLLTAMVNTDGKQLVWQRYVAAAGVAEHVNIDMAEARAQQPPDSMPSTPGAATACLGCEALSSGRLPFGMLLLLCKGLVACSSDTAAAVLACAEHGCSPELRARLRHSPAAPHPWQIDAHPQCAAGEQTHGHAASARLQPSGITASMPACTCAWRRTAAVLTAVCCVQLVAVLAMLRRCSPRSGHGMASAALPASPFAPAKAGSSPDMSPARCNAAAAATPVHSSAHSERSCRCMSGSSCPDRDAGLQASAARLPWPSSADESGRAGHVGRPGQALEQGVKWERTGRRLERALVSGSDVRRASMVDTAPL